MDADVYFHKTVAFNFWKQSLQFRTSQELFSSHDVDVGTRFLLRTIVEANYPAPKCILDVGCGYGPLGLTLKSLYPDSTVHLIDRDALAVAYTRQNVALNGLNGVEIYSSLGYDDVKRNDFDLIVSNIPGHAGENIIASFMLDARHYLAPGGIMAIVVTNALELTVDNILVQNLGADVILREYRSRHVVFHYRFPRVKNPQIPARNALARGVYHREKITMHLKDLKYPMRTAYGLPEFDSLSYGSEMLTDVLFRLGERKFKHVVVFNPGQGHLPVVVWKRLQPNTIVLVDRDLLALRYSCLNLALNGCPPECISVLHQVGLETNLRDKVDLFIGVLSEGGKDTASLDFDRMVAALSEYGIIALSSSSTVINRLADKPKPKGVLRLDRGARWHGFNLLVLGNYTRVVK